MRLGDLWRWLGSLWRVPALETTLPRDDVGAGVPVFIHRCDLVRVDYHTPHPLDRCAICGEVGRACWLNARGVVAVSRG